MRTLHAQGGTWTSPRQRGRGGHFPLVVDDACRWHARGIERPRGWPLREAQQTKRRKNQQKSKHAGVCHPFSTKKKSTNRTKLVSRTNPNGYSGPCRVRVYTKVSLHFRQVFFGGVRRFSHSVSSKIWPRVTGCAARVSSVYDLARLQRNGCYISPLPNS